MGPRVMTVRAIAITVQEQLTHFYLEKPEPAKSCLLALRDIILRFDNNITESLNYGMPLFTCKGKRLCYLWTDKKTGWPYILIVDGNKISHPALEAGDRARMKIFLMNPNEDIPVETIYDIFKMAATLYNKNTAH